MTEIKTVEEKAKDSVTGNEMELVKDTVAKAAVMTSKPEKPKDSGKTKSSGKLANKFMADKYKDIKPKEVESLLKTNLERADRAYLSNL